MPACNLSDSIPCQMEEFEFDQTCQHKACNVKMHATCFGFTHDIISPGSKAYRCAAHMKEGKIEEESREQQAAECPLAWEKLNNSLHGLFPEQSRWLNGREWFVGCLKKYATVELVNRAQELIAEFNNIYDQQT